MKCLNLVILLGRVVTDPDVKELPSGSTVTSLRLVTDEVYVDAQQQRKEVPTFHTLVGYNGIAKTIGQYVKKGDPLQVHGRIRVREYETNGVKKWANEIVVTDLFLMPRADKPSHEKPATDSAAQDRPKAENRAPQRQLPSKDVAPSHASGDDFPQDDVSF